MNGGPPGPVLGIDPTSWMGNRINTWVAKWFALLHDAEGGLEAFLLTARHETVEAVEVEMLIVDRVRELVGHTNCSIRLSSASPV